MSEKQVVNGKPKIVFLNAYSASNRGDLGIVVAMAEFVRRHVKNPDIAVLSDYVDQNRAIYDQYGLRALPSVWNVRQGNLLSKYWRGARAFLSYPWGSNEGLEAIREADLILSVGGGYLYSSRRGPLGVGLLGSLFHIHLANRLRKPVIGFPMSVGPLGSKIDELFVKRVLSRVRLLCSREPTTTGLLARLDLSNTVQAPDIALVLRPGKPSPLPDAGSELRLGITVLDWRFARAVDKSVIDNYVSKVVEVVEKISAVRRAHVYIFPQVTVGGKDSDLPISTELHRAIGENSSTIVDLEKTRRPEDVIATYSQMDLFLASRMHSAIFAIAGKVPTVALAYQPKTRGTFDLIGVPERSFDIASFDPAEVSRVLLDSLGKPVETSLESRYAALGSELEMLVGRS